MCAIPQRNTGLTEVVSIVWCVLLLGPYGMTAPTGNMFWIEPCGGHVGENPSGERRTDAEMLETIRVITERALNTAKSFDEAYTQHLFNGRTVEQTDKDFPDSKLFNPQDVPNKLNEPVPSSHFDRLSEKTLAENLIKQYDHLQTLAIAVEGVVDDQESSRPKFAENYKSLLNTLKQVMCEVHSAISELGYEGQIQHKERPIRQPQDVSYKSIYNWLIYRDYILLMQYLKQTTEFFLAALEKQG
uniref:Pre-mRNA-processing protein 45 n=2 Tax=Lygus hesperus TaxID=30085 RepID=A0A0A9WAS7_LYGHE